MEKKEGDEILRAAGALYILSLFLHVSTPPVILRFLLHASTWNDGPTAEWALVCGLAPVMSEISAQCAATASGALWGAARTGAGACI